MSPDVKQKKTTPISPLSKKEGSNQKPSTEPKKPSPGKDASRTVLMWILVLTAIIVGLQVASKFNGMREVEITYSQYTTLLADSSISIVKGKIIERGSNRGIFHGELSSSAPLDQFRAQGQTTPTRLFAVNLPFIDSQMMKDWNTRGIKFTFEAEKADITDILIGFIPWAILILFWIFMLRQMQAGQKGIFSFGKSRAKIQAIDRPKNTFADAAGVEEAKAELEEIIEFLKDPSKFNRLGGKIPKGVLLLGPPGTGKTLLARCVAGEAAVPFLSMSGSDFVEMFVGVGASRVRDLFETAKKNSPCIIFIDEIDAVGRQRGAGLGGGHDEREQTLNQMLVEMDGFEVNAGIILIAATNRPDVLDPALLRPGRFDRQVVVDIPDIKGREGILTVHTRKIPLAKDVELNSIARGTPGFVGADLANLVNEAALMAARFGQNEVTMLDFEEAKDKVMMGVERKSMVLSDKERKNTAYHEAGHAICNLYCTESDPLHKVTIIPRGRAMGVTFSLPGEDRHSYSKEYLLDRICIMMGGRVAEEMIFGKQTTGASNDIKQATDLARKMICDFGMSDEMGPLSYGEKDEQIFLGRDLGRHRDYSNETANSIDNLMRSVIETQKKRAKEIISEHKDELERLAIGLLEHELLDLEEIKRIIAGELISETKKTRSLLAAKALRQAEKAKAAEKAEKPAEPETPTSPPAEPPQNPES